MLPGRVPVRINPGSGATTPAPAPGSSPSTGAPVAATPAAPKPAASRPATAPRLSDVDESAASEPVNLDIVADLPADEVPAVADADATPTTSTVQHSTERADAATRAPHGATQSPLPIVLAATLGALIVAAAGALWVIIRRRRLA